GNNDPSVAAALNDVAWAMDWNGKYSEAQSLAGEALGIQRQTLGEGHPETARSIAFLGEIMQQRGQLSQADAVLSAAISIQSKLIGEDNPETLYSFNSLAVTLEQEGKWDEAETVHRKALALWRKRSGNEDPQTLWQLQCLIRVLVVEKKYAGAEQSLGEVLTPAFVMQPASANILAQRVDLMGRQGRWQEATTDAALVLKYQPAEHYRYHTLAGLLVITRDIPRYEQLCQTILATFTNNTNPYVAERMADDCLLMPRPGLDLPAVDNLAEAAVRLGGGDDLLPYIQACKAMANYRLGRFTEAVEWAGKPLGGPQVYAEAKACAVLAMADWQLGQKEAAQSMLAKGNTLVPGILSHQGNVDLGDAWVAWLFARIALDEATALLRPASTTVKNLDNP
ncbi:MAG TPA: tetratricopeptide repeat protein, partial [Candidatus Acidoferrum sp.]|nr:tetratricopeptide repeat protein [Candidatus Acidoferrum sp.]